jgi:hypothetical protein
MRLFSLSGWLKAADRKSRGSQRAARRRHRPVPRFVLQVRTLEDRTVLSTLTVTSPLDNGAAGTLRAALASASAGDTIKFAKKLDGQTITLTQGELAVSENLDIEGPGANKLTISGNGVSRVFDISSGVTATIAGLTIAHGFAAPLDGGGGILNEAGAILNLSNDTFRNNTSDELGGGLWSQNGATANVSGCTFVDNVAIGVLSPLAPGFSLGQGGGIDSDGVLTVSNSTFDHNQALGVGGAVLTFGAGGAIGCNPFDFPGSSLTVANCTFTDNSGIAGPVDNGVTFESQGIGGAIENEVGPLTITGSTFTGNRAVAGAGATFLPVPYSFITGGGAVTDVFGPGLVTITTSVFANNVAIGGAGGPGGPGSEGIGGGLDVILGPPLILSDCLFSHNTAIGGAGGSGAPGGNGVGGGVAVDINSTATITNTVMIDNLAIGGVGGAGASGGTGYGGGLSVGDASLFGFPDASSVTVSGCLIVGNLAVGGQGGTGASGGNGFGGGIFIGGPGPSASASA